MTDIKIASIFSKNADNAILLLKNGGQLSYKIRSVEGRTVLDIFITENKHLNNQ